MVAMKRSMRPMQIFILAVYKPVFFTESALRRRLLYQNESREVTTTAVYNIY
jgi:hypothetical protein